jgi:hypothetical protein
VDPLNLQWRFQKSLSTCSIAFSSASEILSRLLWEQSLTANASPRTVSTQKVRGGKKRPFERTMDAYSGAFRTAIPEQTER